MKKEPPPGLEVGVKRERTAVILDTNRVQHDYNKHRVAVLLILVRNRHRAKSVSKLSLQNTTLYTQYHAKLNLLVSPVICRTRYIPRPSSMLLDDRIPITLLGRGRAPLVNIAPADPSCLVGLMLRVGIILPATYCL